MTIGDVSFIPLMLPLNESRELKILTGVPIGLSESGFKKLLLRATSVLLFWMPNLEKSVKSPSFFGEVVGYWMPFISIFALNDVSLVYGFHVEGLNTLTWYFVD